MSVVATRTVDRLKQAMKSKGDFPAVSSSLERIMHSMKDSACSDEKMASLVLGDFALTQKVLRLANSPMYAAFGPVTTVSMALYVLGNETVGHVAMGLKLIDNLGQAADTRVAKQELAKAVVAGAIARNVGSFASGKDGEPLAVATLIRSLGKLLVCFYLPEQFAEIQAAQPSFDDEGAISAQILGLAYDELALNVAEGWNLPPELKSGVALSAGTLDSQANWRHAVTGYALRYITAVSEGGSTTELDAIALQHAEAIGVTSAELRELAQFAVDIALEEANGNMPSFMAPENGNTSRNRKADQTLQHLAAGIADIEAVHKDMTPGQILSMATEVLWKGLGCTKFMLFLRNRQTASFNLVLGRGDGIADKIRKLQFPDAFAPNIFHFALSKDIPIYLKDAFEPNIAKRIPPWLHDAVPAAKNIFLMPFSVGGQPAGILYLDWEVPRGALTKEEESLVERLHTQVSKALTRAASKPAN